MQRTTAMVTGTVTVSFPLWDKNSAVAETGETKRADSVSAEYQLLTSG